MKAHPLSRNIIKSQSITLEEHAYDNFLKSWHYHPEIELAIIRQSTGTRFVGDSIQKFHEGECVLIGKNLPHLWLNDEIYFSEESDKEARAHVIHFHKDFPNVLTAIPEMEQVIALFERARRGILFDPACGNKVAALIDRMFACHDASRFLLTLEILQILSEQHDYQLLASLGYMEDFTKATDNRMERVLQYIMQHFTQHISLEEAADQANMNPSSFSRYFKRNNKKTFSRYVNEVRVGFACKLLIEQQYNISEICYRSGFNSISNFNRRFKELKNMTPTQYIQRHLKGH